MKDFTQEISSHSPAAGKASDQGMTWPNLPGDSGILFLGMSRSLCALFARVQLGARPRDWRINGCGIVQGVLRGACEHQKLLNLSLQLPLTTAARAAGGARSPEPGEKTARPLDGKCSDPRTAAALPIPGCG